MAGLKNKKNKTEDRADLTAEESICEGDQSWEIQIAQLLMKVEASIDIGKSSVSDFIRLLNLHRECEEDSITQITVCWVDPAEVK